MCVCVCVCVSVYVCVCVSVCMCVCDFMLLISIADGGRVSGDSDCGSQTSLQLATSSKR